MGVTKTMVKTDSGLEEERPVFICECGCKDFTLIRRTMVAVDFSIEGAIEGHPHIRDAGLSGEYQFLCYSCGEKVPAGKAEEMYAEVI